MSGVETNQADQTPVDSHAEGAAKPNGTNQNTSPPQPGEVERLRSELRAALERLEQFIKLDDQDRHTADNEEDRQFFVGRANGLRTAVNYIRGCGAIDCVNACDGDFTHETCPSARAALTPSESQEAVSPTPDQPKPEVKDV